jgi:hypothetical protein
VRDNGDIPDQMGTRWRDKAFIRREVCNLGMSYRLDWLIATIALVALVAGLIALLLWI